MTKSLLRVVQDGDLRYEALMFWCPGCGDEPSRRSGLHMLPVNTSVTNPQWDWDENLEQPSLNPSILTRSTDFVCHSYLRQGVFEFLSDCTHQYTNMKVPIPDLPQWVLDD